MQCVQAGSGRRVPARATRGGGRSGGRCLQTRWPAGVGGGGSSSSGIIGGWRHVAGAGQPLQAHRGPGSRGLPAPTLFCQRACPARPALPAALLVCLLSPGAGRQGLRPVCGGSRAFQTRREASQGATADGGGRRGREPGWRHQLQVRNRVESSLYMHHLMQAAPWPPLLPDSNAHNQALGIATPHTPSTSPPTHLSGEEGVVLVLRCADIFHAVAILGGADHVEVVTQGRPLVIVGGGQPKPAGSSGGASGHGQVGGSGGSRDTATVAASAGNGVSLMRRPRVCSTPRSMPSLNSNTDKDAQGQSSI
jgi:hypothetical protein